MSTNQHTGGAARSPNQKNSISEDPGDGARHTDHLGVEPETEPGTQGADRLDELGRRGTPRALDG